MLLCIFWIVLAIVYVSLSYVSRKEYLYVKKFAGNELAVVITKKEERIDFRDGKGSEFEEKEVINIGIEKRSDLDNLGSPAYFDLTRAFKRIFGVDMVGFIAAAIAAIISLCYLS